MTVVPGRGKCYFSSKSSEQDHLLEGDGRWGNSTEVRQSPWKWVGLGWQSKLVWVPSGAVIEAFFMLTNRELRLAFWRTGSNQWLLRFKRGTSLQWMQRSGDLDFHFTCPSPGTWPVRKQRQTPRSSSRASALCGGHQGAPDCEAEPMKGSLLYIWLRKEALWLDSTSFLQSPTAERLWDLQTGKGTNEGQSCQSEEQKMACIAGVAWDVA